MDELLIESKGIWRRSIARLLDSYGVSQSAVDSLYYRGLSAADTASLIHRTFHINSDMRDFYQDFAECLLCDVREHAVVPHAGALRSVRTASKTAPVSVASGSPLVVIHSVLRQLGLHQAVHIVVSSEEVSAGKPDPDIFLEAARRLGVDARGCVVFEDSFVGVQAAIGAGMRCVAVPSELNGQIKQLTPYVYPSLDTITWPDRVVVDTPS